MDCQVKRKGDMAFHVIKNIIKKQNEELLRNIAHKTQKPVSFMLEKYLKPEYYLPLVVQQK